METRKSWQQVPGLPGCQAASCSRLSTNTNITAIGQAIAVRPIPSDGHSQGKVRLQVSVGCIDPCTIYKVVDCLDGHP